MDFTESEVYVEELTSCLGRQTNVFRRDGNGYALTHSGELTRTGGRFYVGEKPVQVHQLLQIRGRNPLELYRVAETIHIGRFHD